MQRFSVALASVLLLLFGGGEALAESSALRTYGDILQYALPAAAFATSYLRDDKKGEKPWLREMGSSLATT